jgi:hypothetical protein
LKYALMSARDVRADSRTFFSTDAGTKARVIGCSEPARLTLPDIQPRPRALAVLALGALLVALEAAPEALASELSNHLISKQDRIAALYIIMLSMHIERWVIGPRIGRHVTSISVGILHGNDIILQHLRHNRPHT